MPEPIIRASELVRTYGPIRAVDGVSFDVAPGEVFGFLGPNGAGKTTTISILCTLLRPTGGHAVVAGHDVTAAPAEVRRRIGVVFQDPSLDIYLTARENMLFHAAVYGIPKAEASEHADELLRMVDLYERRNHQVQTFSGGMRRRLEMARGLLHHPSVLFLDEPTIGLDPQSRKHLWAYILEVARSEGITIFLTTHYMEEAEHCSRIAIMDQGQIIALDTPVGLKRRIGGDALTMSTTDDEKASRFMSEQLSLEPTLMAEGIHVAVPDGDQAIPRILAALPVDVTSVKLTRPTLDDVFIELTGRHIRDEEAGGMEGFRNIAASRMRAGRNL